MKTSLRKFLSWSHRAGCTVILTALTWLAGCSGDPAKQALETDANGYLCQGCKNKFYTERQVFADACPQCKSMQLSQVVGFVCPADNHLTVAPRASGFTACEKCGKPTSSQMIPRESDFKAWGAPKKTKAEVGG